MRHPIIRQSVLLPPWDVAVALQPLIRTQEGCGR